MAMTLEENLREWRSFVARVLGVWGGYQLGVDFNSGGAETRQKHEWFIDVLAEFICTTRSLKADALEEWITALLYSEFDLILDDDSVYPTSFLLLEGYGYLKNNDQARYSQLVAGLPTQQTVQEAKSASRREGGDDEEMEMSDVDEDMAGEQGEDDDESGPSSGRERLPKTVTDEDGWTTIVKR